MAHHGLCKGVWFQLVLKRRIVKYGFKCCPFQSALFKKLPFHLCAARYPAELQSLRETRESERGEVAAAERRAREAEHAAQAAVNAADLVMQDAKSRVAAAEQETQRQLEAAEASRRDIEKAVRERLAAGLRASPELV